MIATQNNLTALLMALYFALLQHRVHVYGD